MHIYTYLYTYTYMISYVCACVRVFVCTHAVCYTTIASAAMHSRSFRS